MTRSVEPSTRARTSRLVAGCSTARRPATRSTSACACRSSTPGFRRPRTVTGAIRPPGQVRFESAERREDFALTVGDRVANTQRQHPNDGPRHGVEHDHPAQDGGVRMETAAPRGVRNHHHRRRGRMIIRVRENPPRKGFTRSTSNSPADTLDPDTCSGSPMPVRLTSAVAGRQRLERQVASRRSR